MNIQLFMLGLLLLVIGIMYVNLTSTTTDCLRENSIKSSINQDFTILYINLVLGILLILISLIWIYTGIYSTQKNNIPNNNLEFLSK